MAAWMLYTFLDTSKRFGRDIPLHVNPFDPDKVGGLAPLSDLSTLAVFCVGLLSLLIIPIWQIFFSPASYVMIGVTSILIPAYFLYAMRGIYNRLREERESSLAELNDEIQQVSKRIRTFMKTDHEKERFDEKETVLLGQTLNSVDIIYGHVRSMHTFPINAEIMAKVFVSAILPILAVILNFTLSHFP
jgi:ABC-type multidrug transport system fused ATPase/permease subunit